MGDTEDLRISDVADMTGLSVRYWQREARLGNVPGARADTNARGRKIYLFDKAKFQAYWETRLVPVPYKPPSMEDQLDCLVSVRREQEIISATRRWCQWVYFVESAGLIKIGHSTRLRERLGSLKCSNPMPLTLIGVVYGNQGDEQVLHEQFAKSRVHGEWFRPTPELLAFIEKEATP